MVIKKTAFLDLPLHKGKAPKWLFKRMIKFARIFLLLFAEELGSRRLLFMLSNPLWFQALGCVMGFDWHSSGLTTTVCGALKEANKGIERDTGIFIAGGKGKTSLKTPEELEKAGYAYSIDADRLRLISKLVAKVDNACVQDGYNLYHHVMVVDLKDQNWAIIQQGMNVLTKYARRYHWLGIDLNSFVQEPHSGFFAWKKEGHVLNLTAKDSTDCREKILYIANNLKLEEISFYMRFPLHHYIKLSERTLKTVEKQLINLKQLDRKLKRFEELLLVEKIGPSSLRALALVSDLLFNASPSFKDPATYSYAHGGKDGHPYPVKRKLYDKTISIMEKSLKKTEHGSRLNSLLKRLAFVSRRVLSAQGN